jgi:sulfur relay protein TusB/DsrH
MGSYVLVETRDPFQSGGVQQMYDLATGLADQGDDVTVFLAQNGVLAARRAATTGDRIADLARRAKVVADDFSLRERGIRADDLAAGVGEGSMEALVDLVMEDGRKVIWH